MSRQAMEQALGKLVMDVEFRDAFFSDAAEATRHAGIEITEHERDTLALIRPGALAAFKRYLDQRCERIPDTSDRIVHGRAVET